MWRSGHNILLLFGGCTEWTLISDALSTIVLMMSFVVKVGWWSEGLEQLFDIVLWIIRHRLFNSVVLWHNWVLVEVEIAESAAWIRWPDLDRSSFEAWIASKERQLRNVATVQVWRVEEVSLVWAQCITIFKEAQSTLFLDHSRCGLIGGRVWVAYRRWIILALLRKNTCLLILLWLLF